MRIPRIYLAAALVQRPQIELPPDTSHYLCVVLRMETGRPLICFDGAGGEYQATLVAAHKRAAVIELGEPLNRQSESPLRTHLALGVSRGDKMDLVIQKATELGVSEITPLFTERTEVKLRGERLAKKMNHWRQVLISACEQCGRNRLPLLHPARPINDFLPADTAGLKLVLHHRSETSITRLQRPGAASLLIGPEGGLTAAEIDMAVAQYGYTPLTLGPRILRTETAPLVALSALQVLWGDLA